MNNELVIKTADKGFYTGFNRVVAIGSYGWEKRMRHPNFLVSHGFQCCLAQALVSAC